VQFGLMAANVFFPDPDAARAVACAAEQAGFDSVWTVEHVLIPAGYRSIYPYAPDGKMPGGEVIAMPDPLIWLAYVATATTTIQLATGVVIAPLRNPAVLAKEVATLDHLSNGRVRLGVGAGWLAEEFAALGVPFHDRGQRLDGYIEAIRALWSGEATTLDNGFVSYERAISKPPPAHPVPIVIGGHTSVAARRAGRVGDGFFPGKADHLPALLEVMRAAADQAGRDPDAIEVTLTDPALLGPDPLGEVERMAKLGVDRLVVVPPAYDAATMCDSLYQFGEQVIGLPIR
jgi:probable F420-dependent oxidoreductase